MIGNDIVDLKLAKIESNWQRKNFLNKIFTKSEQLIILNATNPEIMVWNLWSRKEAAYKIWNRKTQIRSYNPIQFECFYTEKKIGLVRVFNEVYYVKTIVNQQFIYSIAVTNQFQFDFVKTISKNEIVKRNGLPYFINPKNSQVVISITNHGDFEKVIMI